VDNYVQYIQQCVRQKPLTSLWHSAVYNAFKLIPGTSLSTDASFGIEDDVLDAVVSGCLGVADDVSVVKVVVGDVIVGDDEVVVVVVVGKMMDSFLQQICKPY